MTTSAPSDSTQPNAIARVGVVGGGLMGAGIAQVSAQAGIPTVVRELSDALCQRARGSIERSLGKAIEKGTLTAQSRDTALGCLAFTTDLADVAGCDLVVEAVVEVLDVKNALWRARRTRRA